VQAGRAILAAILAAGVVVGASVPLAAQASAQPQGGAGSAPKPVDGTQAPAAEPKPDEGGAQRPAEAPKRAEEPAPKLKLVSILGRDVANREGDGGRVIDVLVDHEGRLGAVVVEFGGFMGIGSRKVAVDWSALRFVREGNRTALMVDISREQIRDAAEYKAGESPSVLGK
jgi:hypothetical protein